MAFFWVRMQLDAFMAGVWRFLGTSWPQLGASWTPLGRNLEPLGGLLGPTWRFGMPLRCSLEHASNWSPNAIRSPLGDLWRALGGRKGSNHKHRFICTAPRPAKCNSCSWSTRTPVALWRHINPYSNYPWGIRRLSRVLQEFCSTKIISFI